MILSIDNDKLGYSTDEKKLVEASASAGKFIAPILRLGAFIGTISYKVFGKKKIK